jgi:hypothetical protein
MTWIDTLDYFGPTRRRRRAMRLFDRRRCDQAQLAPSLRKLLRKLQHWSTDLATQEPADVERYCARVQVVADLARQREEFEVEARLRSLDMQLQLNARVSVADVSNRVQAAILMLR